MTGPDLRIGCSSWTSEAWWGKVYPKGIADGDRLAVYARTFDAVEVDSSYYRDPGSYLIHRWAAVTPDRFVFTLKFPRDLLDPKAPLQTEAISTFLRHASGLGAKLGPVLLQFPPWFRPGRSEEFLDSVLGALEPSMRFAVELRDRAWYEGPTWARLEKKLGDRSLALAWSYLTYLEVPDALTSDLIYLRFIGDHTTVPAEMHGSVRVDRTTEMRLWVRRVQERSERVKAVYVFFNNHFQGFAPESVNLFRREMGLPPVEYAPRP